MLQVGNSTCKVLLDVRAYLELQRIVKSSITLRTFFPFEYGIIIYQGHAGFQSLSTFMSIKGAYT